MIGMTFTAAVYCTYVLLGAGAFKALTMLDQYRWLSHALTVDKIRELLPEAEELEITRHLFPGIRAVNFVIDGILGQGVAYQARFDPQAKGLGEWLRSRHIEIPEEILK